MQICINGRIQPAGEPGSETGRTAFNGRHGIFETIFLHRGRMPLLPLHLDRLHSSLGKLGFDFSPDESGFIGEVQELAKANDCLESARVRLTVFQEENANDQPGKPVSYVVEAVPFDSSIQNRSVSRLGIYPRGQKASDEFSHLKLCDAGIYVQAAKYASDQGWDDALVLNTRYRAADTTIANLFYVKDGLLFTPSLDEGCIAGVMRRWILEEFGDQWVLEERPVTLQELEFADEIFLSNALRGVMTVDEFEGKKLRVERAREIAARFRNIW